MKVPFIPYKAPVHSAKILSFVALLLCINVVGFSQPKTAHISTVDTFVLSGISYQESPPAANTESISALRIKYALMLDTTIESLNNDPLYHLIDDWLGTPYRYGGNDSSGIDCSSFSGILYQNMYGISLPRTSKAQSEQVRVLDEAEWSEGDLVFFKTGGKQISHVGIYLGNRKFVHASTMKGVTIDSIDYPYYKKRFAWGGRIWEGSDPMSD